MANSSIEWTEKTWNPTVGCTKVSTGCKRCYAEVMHKRLQGMGKTTGNPKYDNDFGHIRPYVADLNAPRRWKKGSVIFVNSMSDLFHESLSLAYIKMVFQVMNETPQHTYQVLTKRANLLELYSASLTWTDNIWMGVSIESGLYVSRIDHLRASAATVKFLSLEPLVGPLPNLNLSGIDWVIVGGESGHNARPMNPEWVEDIRLQCEAAGTAFFFKQWGGANKKLAGRLLNGQTYDAMPTRQPIR